MPTLIRLGSTVVIAALTAWIALSAQSPPQPTTGADAYREYCAGCHGRSGRGDGPVAPTLRTPVPDLSKLASTNGGRFPRQRVQASISNTQRPLAAHGTGDMPVWGHVFGAIDGDAPRVRQRIEELVSFVETLQQPFQVSEETGRALFEAYCAGCHGPVGTGGVGPDLTGYAMRNGGVFPSARLAQVIDGRGVAAHGPRTMPVWGDAFRRIPGAPGQQAAAARVEAVTRYLQSIQRRLGDE